MCCNSTTMKLQLEGRSLASTSLVALAVSSPSNLERMSWASLSGRDTRICHNQSSPTAGLSVISHPPERDSLSPGRQLHLAPRRWQLAATFGGPPGSKPRSTAVGLCPALILSLLDCLATAVAPRPVPAAALPCSARAWAHLCVR